MSNLTMTYGTAKNLTANSFVKTGHTFKGWNTKADGSGTSYADKQSVKNLSATNNATITLYAQWTNEDVLVYFDERGGYCPEAGKTVKYGQPYGELPVPVLDGYGFIGWYTSADGGELVTESTIVTATDTHTLYAHWGPPDITYVINPGRTPKHIISLSESI